jgi:adhesin transport system outer membrane protein
MREKVFRDDIHPGEQLSLRLLQGTFLLGSLFATVPAAATPVAPVNSAVAIQPESLAERGRLGQWFERFSPLMDAIHPVSEPVIRASGLARTLPAGLEAQDADTVHPQVAELATPATTPDFIQLIHLAVQRHPAIAQVLSLVWQQQAGVDVARAGYWPQMQAGISTGRLGTPDAGRQLFTLSASQMLYDFGKVKHGVLAAEALENRQKAQVLKQIDSIASQTASIMVNIRRYQALEKIAQARVQGIGRILEIARLRANAGISSQADPIQAKTRYEAAQANLLFVQSSLQEWRQRLRTLIGPDIPPQIADIPLALAGQAQLSRDPDVQQIPDVLIAESERQAAIGQLHAAKAKRMPTVSLDTSLSKAFNGINPNNGKDDSTYGSVMLSVNGIIAQGGALLASQRAAGYAEQAAKSAIDAAYLNVMDQVRVYREQIRGGQARLQVLAELEQSSSRTRELYQEQYKLGTRSILDLLSAEQDIHQAASDRENTRYDIWVNVVNYINVTGQARAVYALNHHTIQGVDIEP